MNLFSLLSFLLATALGGGLGGRRAVAATFYGVPESCERGFLRVAGANLKDVIDWRRWSNYLRALGYTEDAVAHLLRTHWWVPEDLDGDFQNVTLWSGLANYDVPGAVLRGIETAQRRWTYLTDTKVRDLMQTAPFWLDSQDRRGVARKLFEVSNVTDFSRILAGIESILGSPARDEIHRTLIERVKRQVVDSGWRSETHFLVMLSFVPWSRIPESLRRLLTEHWIDLENYPAWYTDRIHPAGFGLTRAGDCQDMYAGHAEALDLPHLGLVDPKLRLVKVDGRLIGAIKPETCGEASMIALRNVFDAQNRLVLALGAVYNVPHDIATDVDRSVIELDRLALGPSNFLLNRQAWHNDPPTALLKLIMEPENAERVAEAISAGDFDNADYEDDWSDPEESYHVRMIRALHRSLDRFRTENERP